MGRNSNGVNVSRGGGNLIQTPKDYVPYTDENVAKLTKGLMSDIGSAKKELEIIKDMKGEFASDVAESVLRYNRASEKQSAILAKAILNNYAIEKGSSLDKYVERKSIPEYGRLRFAESAKKIETSIKTLIDNAPSQNRSQVKSILHGWAKSLAYKDENSMYKIVNSGDITKSILIAAQTWYSRQKK